jgi:hypothetical protein
MRKPPLQLQQLHLRKQKISIRSAFAETTSRKAIEPGPGKKRLHKSCFAISIDNHRIPTALVHLRRFALLSPMNKISLATLTAFYMCAQTLPAAAQQYRPLPSTPQSYTDGSISRSANNGNAAQARFGLPKTVHSQFTGQPGDELSRGNFQGNGRQPRVGGDQGQMSVLPRCRSSAFMDGYGDHVRSDMGRRIDGTPIQRAVARTPAQLNQQRVQRQTTPVYSYGNGLTPVYKRSSSY